jgi:hypothetical protein
MTGSACADASLIAVKIFGAKSVFYLTNERSDFI